MNEYIIQNLTKREIGIKESDKKLYDLAITYVKSHFDYINNHK